MSHWRYYMARALGGFRKNPLPAAVSVLVVGLCLFMTGLCSLGFWGIYRIAPHLLVPSKAVIYLKEGVSVQEARGVQKTVAGWPLVAACHYKSPQEVLEELRDRYGGWEDLFQGLGENPLPPALEVRLQVREDMEGAMRAFEDKAKALEPVQDVLTARSWSGETLRRMRTVLGMGLALLVVWIACSILIVANTVRLAFYGRRDEVEVLRVVGASPSFIKMPFYLEGILQGVLGAALAASLLWLTGRMVGAVLPPSLAAGIWPLGAGAWLWGILPLAGAGLSWLGARLALRRLASY
ncbi:cell division protein FtsX [Desulfacinum hydrothermale]|nr:permease-like cell division protein FtsX [Desulfacinum hydrothermale]